MRESWKEIHQAVSAIAAQCDGAQSQDSVGFNGHDTKFGKRSAAMSVEEWTQEIAAEVYKMLRTYKGQLAIAGIDYGKLPVVDTESHDSYTARDQARQAEYRRKNAAYIDILSGAIHVYNSYPIKDELRRNGFAWNRPVPDKSWQAAMTSQSAATILGIDSIVLSEIQRSKLEAIAGDVQPAEKPVNILVSKRDSNRLEIHTEFGQVPLAVLRAMPGRHWDGQNRVNIVDAHFSVLRVAEEFNLTISDDAAALIESNRAKHEAEIARAQEVYADSLATDTDMEVAISENLYGYQRAGVAYGIKHRGRVLIADEMGLGKTRQALSLLETQNAYPALVLCPATVKGVWQKEIAQLLPHRRVLTYYGRNKQESPYVAGDILIMNYEILASYLDCLPQLHGLVVDESHYIKNEKADRTLAVKEITLGKFVRDKTSQRMVRVAPPKIKRDGVVAFLTGTPILNRPVELVQPLLCLGYLKQEKGYENSVSKFLYSYCGPEKNGWGTTFNGATNTHQLNEWLRKTCMVRRTKTQVLTELPPKVRAPQFIALSSSAQSFYLKLAKEGAEKAAQTRAEAIVYLNALRTAIGKAKIDQACLWADDFLETGKSLVIYADGAYVQAELVKRLSAKHRCTKILGGAKPAAVEEAKAGFQSGKYNVIVLSFRAAREGHTLTAASDVLFVELGWNPGTHNQAEDRCHRIGQDDSVTAWYIIAQETIDEWTWELIEMKRKIVNSVTDGAMGTDDEQSVFAELLDRAIAAYGGK